MASAPTSETLIAAARALAPRIRDCYDAIERGRQLPAALVAAFRAAGFFRMWVPCSAGGYETDPATFIRVAEEVARIDGAAGWNLVIGAGNAIVAGWLVEEATREVFGADPDAPTGGVYGPVGRAVATAGGYRVTGRWAYGSGGQHCTWMVGGCFVYDGDERRLNAAGKPVTRIMLFPAADCAFIDTWHVAGLRGTGSNDFAVDGVFVPAARSFSFGDAPLQPGPLYNVPRFGLLACALTGVHTGIARHAIDALVELAGAKTPTGQTSLLRERAAVQADVARAEALVRGAQAFRGEILTEVWETVVVGETPTMEQRALLVLAATRASVASAQAVDLMYNAGGATAIYESSPLERCFRDIHVATQHWMVQPSTYEVAGRALLGFDMSDSPI